jgi:hypothetical protein
MNHLTPMAFIESPGTMQPATAITSDLRLMLDSADERQWQEWLPLGLFYGVTTNPLLLARAQVPCEVESLATLLKMFFGCKNSSHPNRDCGGGKANS